MSTGGPFALRARPCPVCHSLDFCEHRQENFQRMMVCAAAARELRTKTDAEIATLLEEHVGAELSILDVTGDLVDEAIERLRRTGAGARVVEEEDV